MQPVSHSGGWTALSLLTGRPAPDAGMFAPLLMGTMAVSPVAASSPEGDVPAETPAVEIEAARAPRSPGLHRYLTRARPHGPRFLDHGVLGVGVAGGFPHLYRVELRLGLLDHLTIGATAHWLPGQRYPGWSPLVSLAFVRTPRFEVGASYRQVLHPPPKHDEDPTTPGFQERTHYFLGAVTFSQAWFAAGFDVGVANLRVPDPAEPDSDDLYVIRTRLAGGLHVRAGTRRFGLTLQAQAPDLSVEAVVDVRFDLFELRERGAWLDY